MSLIPRLPLFAAAFTLLSLTLALVFLSGQSAPAAQAQTTPTTTTTVDYDSNDDRLIEISNLAQLNAVRWDLDGDGAVAAADQANYTAAFTNAAAGMGCPDGSDADTNPDPCLGYELKADLTFDTNGDGSVTIADSGGLYWNNGAGWTPIGLRATGYTGQFQGRGKTISRLFINNNSTDAVGLFAAVGQGGQVAGLGLEQVSIASGSGSVAAGSLAGLNAGSITASYAKGALATSAGTAAASEKAFAGGLVGVNFYGTVQASFAEVAVSATHNQAGIAGGLVGDNLLGDLKASYAAGSVTARGSNSRAGGLVGSNDRTITASYARGRVAATGTGSAAGGLVGSSLRTATVTASYWDTAASGQSGSAGGTGQTTRALQTPSGYNYSGLYAGWNLNLDGVAGGDSPWYFGGANQYPLLVYGAMRDFPLWDYDADNDQLIEVNSLAQLNAIRWDLNTDGVVAAADQDKYDAAFPGAVAGMGCALGTTAAACNGYELMSDLDFDTDGDGDVDAADSGGLYWNSEWAWSNVWGWTPVGRYDVSFTGTFQGNGKTIANLYIHQPPSDNVVDLFGLFGWIGSTGVIDGVNLRDANIRTQYGGHIGHLAGGNNGIIRGSSATGRINSDGTQGESVGGLVGENYGSIASSYAKVEISADDVSVGGLAGRNSCLSPDYTICGSIVASYASGADVTVNRSVGGGFARVEGLVGVSSGPITASYSRSPVKATGNGVLVGGLVGANYSTITAAYSRSPVEVTGNGAKVGGLAGKNSGTIAAAYSLSPVKATDNTASVGGLVGSNNGTITAAYSRSPVKATGNGTSVGGLVGQNFRWTYEETTSPGIITASYAVGPVVTTGTNPAVGGLVGRNGSIRDGQEVANSKGTAVDSYWDIAVSGQSSSALGTGMRGHGPTSYTGLFANWNLNLDGVAGKDDPWELTGGHYPMLKYGGLSVADQAQLYIWRAPVVGETARTSWSVSPWLTRARGQKFVWERSDDGVTGWTVVLSNQAGIGLTRGGSVTFFIEPYEANKRFRVRGLSVERGWISGYITKPVVPWRGPTATLTFASGHTTPRVGQAIAISGSDNVRWIRCADTADNGCDVIVRSATGYTPVAADQGKYLYAYRYYDNSSGVKTMGKTAVIGPVAAAAASSS